MASVMQSLSLTLFFTLLFFPNPTFSVEIPESSPSPSPQLPPPPQLSPQAISPPPTTPAPSPAFPDSPPAPPPLRIAPVSPSPAPSPAEDEGAYKKTPSPAPIAAADDGEADQSHLDDLERRDDSGGMSSEKKAGIAIGVIAAGCLVVLAAMVYKKRQYNIRRRQYSYTDRRDFL